MTGLSGWRDTFPQLVIQSSYCRPLNISSDNCPAATCCKVRRFEPRAGTTLTWTVGWQRDRCVLPLFEFFSLYWTAKECLQLTAGEFCGESPTLLFYILFCFEPVCLMFFIGLTWAPCSEWRTYWFCSRSTDRNTGSADAQLHVPCCKFFPAEHFSPGL